MNIFHFNLLFSAWRSRSVTISLVFALAMQGIWAGVHLREFFRSAGMFWFQVWILPFIVVWLFARYEPKLLPSEKLRRYLSYALIIVSLIFGGTLARYQSKGERGADGTSYQRTGTGADSFKRLGTKPGIR
jgi:hypothetical protein